MVKVKETQVLDPKKLNINQRYLVLSYNQLDDEDYENFEKEIVEIDFDKLGDVNYKLKKRTLKSIEDNVATFESVTNDCGENENAKCEDLVLTFREPETNEDENEKQWLSNQELNGQKILGNAALQRYYIFIPGSNKILENKVLKKIENRGNQDVNNHIRGFLFGDKEGGRKSRKSKRKIIKNRKSRKKRT